MNVGSLFSGIGGLDLAVEQHFGAELAWLCEYDQPARGVLERRFPGVPCFPDVRELGTDAPAVDILVGGYPCQPFSVAGLRRGEDDPRHLWPHFARLVRVLRPRIVVAENVAGHLRLGFDAVVADLASLGMDVCWGVVRASDAGAPHQRARLFIVAWDPARWRCVGGPDIEGRGSPGRDGAARTGEGTGAVADPVVAGIDADGRSCGRDPRQPRGSAQAALPSRPEVALAADAVADRSGSVADADSERSHGWRGADARGTAGGRPDGRSVSPRRWTPAADADRGGREGVGLQEPQRVEGSRRGVADGRDAVRQLEHTSSSVPDAARHLRAEQPQSDGREQAVEFGVSRAGGGTRGGDPAAGVQDVGRGAGISWGVYEAAVRRWEHLTGHAAPRPTDDRGRLMPEFVEWMMDYPVGWTEGASRTQRLKMLGNAVVPAQALLALRLLTGCRA